MTRKAQDLFLLVWRSHDEVKVSVERCATSCVLLDCTWDVLRWSTPLRMVYSSDVRFYSIVATVVAADLSIVLVAV